MSVSDVGAGKGGKKTYTPAIHGKHADGVGGGIFFSHRNVFADCYLAVSD